MNPARNRSVSAKSTQNPGKFTKALISHRKDAARSLGRLARSPLSSLMTVLVIALALLLPTLLYLLASNLGDLLREFEDSARITLYLDEAVTESEGISVSDNLLQDPDIELAGYISASQALAEFSAASGFTEILSGLNSNPLPATIVLRPSPSGLQAIDELAARLGRLPEVEQVQLDAEWLQRLRAIGALLGTLFRVFGIVVLLGLCFIVGNTIRQGVESHRDEIRVIKLVGGTDGFIARPFLYTGFVLGFLGGVFAYLLLLLVMQGLADPLANLAQLYHSSPRIGVPGPGSALALAGAGALTGWVAALLASFRYISAVEP